MTRFSPGINVVLVLLSLAGAGQTRLGAQVQAGAERRQSVSAAELRRSAERGLQFLTADAVKWKAERKCSSCHHGVMTVWAMAEGKQDGFSVDPALFSEMVTWTKERLAGIDKPRDSRPRFSMVSTPALYLSLMALTIPKQDALSTDELNAICGHLLRHQEDDGSWSWASAPAQNRPPPVFESDEVATLMGCMAVRSGAARQSQATSPLKTSLDHAGAWLSKNSANRTTQAAALKLISDATQAHRIGLRQEIDQLLKLQNTDGGWPQTPGDASDAHATGQALYALSLAGVNSTRKEAARGISFLVRTQKNDGSWQMIPRSHPGAKPMTSPVPITYNGSAWATMALMRQTLTDERHPAIIKRSLAVHATDDPFDQ